jgi:mycothiol synthase
MSAYVIRPFGPKDLAPVVALWSRSLAKDPMTEDRFWHFYLLDCNFDPAGALVAEAGGEVVGYLQAIVRKFPMGSLGTQPTMGWIPVFFVAPERRRQGLGTNLLEAGLSYLRSQGRTEVMINGYSPCYVTPGIDADYTEALAFVEQHGFAKVSEPLAMGMRLDGQRMPQRVKEKWAALKTEGYEIRMFERGDTLPLLAFAEKHFPHWQPSVLDGLQRANMEIVVATKGERIVGFTQWENTYNDPPNGAGGRFGPFGVDPTLRSQGIGAVIFYYLIERVVGKGARFLWFGWGGGRNYTFYTRAGCEVLRQFRLFKRAL